MPTKITTLEQQLAHKKEQIKNLQNALKAARSDVRAAKHGLGNAQETLEKARIDLDSASCERQRFREENQALKADNWQLEQERDRLRQQTADLKLSLQSQQAKREEAEKQTAVAKQQVSEAIGRNSAAKRTADDYKHQIEAMTADRDLWRRMHQKAQINPMQVVAETMTGGAARTSPLFVPDQVHGIPVLQIYELAQWIDEEGIIHHHAAGQIKYMVECLRGRVLHLEKQLADWKQRAADEAATVVRPSNEIAAMKPQSVDVLNPLRGLWKAVEELRKPHGFCAICDEYRVLDHETGAGRVCDGCLPF